MSKRNKVGMKIQFHIKVSTQVASLASQYDMMTCVLSDYCSVLHVYVNKM